jgi:membrane fusion protein (multidrug efflux system)
MKNLIQNKKLLVAAVIVLLSIAIAVYIKFSAHTRSTENAYVGADVVQIAAQVGGRVTALLVNDNQMVHKGDVLFEIDPEPFRIALTRAEANLAQAMQNARQDNADAVAARAQITQTEADLINARSHYARAKDMVAKNFASQQTVDDALAKVLSLSAAMQQVQAKLNRALAAPANSDERADVLRAQAEIAQAKLDLAHTKVITGQEGFITNLSLTAGSLVAPGIPLFALIEKNSFHVDANFKETELPGIHPGQVADIEIDMYPGQPFHGKVNSLSGGTGTAFSLLPPQNATGNWVKIAQRVPVKITLDKYDDEHPLRIGATATVTVHLD